MQGSPEVIAVLQAAIASEAHLNLQYRLDWRAVRNIGAKKTAKKLKEYGHDAHDWLRKVVDRVLFFEADPSYQIPPMVQQADLESTLEHERELELAIVKPYEEAVQACMKALDDTSRNLFEHLLKWHQNHIAWLEIQLRLIKAIGETEYIAEKL